MQTESTQIQEIDPEFGLSPEDTQFFLSQTGITDLEEIKSHIFSIKEEAMKVLSLCYIHTLILIQRS